MGLPCCLQQGDLHLALVHCNLTSRAWRDADGYYDKLTVHEHGRCADGVAAVWVLLIPETCVWFWWFRLPTVAMLKLLTSKSLARVSGYHKYQKDQLITCSQQSLLTFA